MAAEASVEQMLTGESEAAPATRPAPVVSQSADVDVGALLDIPVTMSLEVGRSRVSIRNLLQLSQGSIIELERAAGQPLDVFVNGTLVAHGEVVVINEKFGIRLTDVISPAERIRKLK
jgi:flagellar motor switch protein FliN/FliY